MYIVVRIARFTQPTWKPARLFRPAQYQIATITQKQNRKTDFGDSRAPIAPTKYKEPTKQTIGMRGEMPNAMTRMITWM